MQNIKLTAKVTAVEQPYSDKKDYAVTLECGRALKQILRYGFTGYQPWVTDKLRSDPERGLVVLQIHGEPDLKVGGGVCLEIEAA